MSILHEAPSLWRWASVFSLGFFPLFEGNVAVPVGLALGMNPILAVCVSVLGTTTQTLLVRSLASRLLSVPRVAAWWERTLSDRLRRLFTSSGVNWLILIGIPWTGGLPTALCSRMAGIGNARYARWAIGGLILHATVLALLIRLGLHAAGKV